MEGTFAHRGDALRNGDRGDGGDARKGILANAQHGQFGTIQREGGRNVHVAAGPNIPHDVIGVGVVHKGAYIHNIFPIYGGSQAAPGRAKNGIRLFGGNQNFFQIHATKKSSIADVHYTVRNGDIGEAVVVRQSAGPNRFKTAWQGDAGEAVAVKKHVFLQTGDTVWQVDASEAVATRESAAAQCGKPAWQGDSGKSFTHRKGIFAYRGEAKWQNDACQGTAASKSSVRNGCGSLGNGDGGDALVSREDSS